MNWSTVRRVTMLALLLVIVAAIIVPQLIGVPNPTGRRYSSQVPAEVARELGYPPENVQALGLIAERVLQADLDVPNNNSPGEMTCLCGAEYSSTVPNSCNTCALNLPDHNGYFVPDFITTDFIADSKYVNKLQPSTQMKAFVAAAETLDRPLWIFVRIGDATDINPVLLAQIEATGGGVVPYFRMLNPYYDPLETGGFIVAVVAIVLLAGLGFFEVRRIVRGWQLPDPEDPPRSDKVIMPKPLDKVERKMGDAEDYVKRAIEKRRIEIEIEEPPGPGPNGKRRIEIDVDDSSDE